MSRRQTAAKKHFTIDQANATLPLVRAIATDLARLSREVLERRRRLAILLDGHDPNRNDPYHQELMQIQEELDKDLGRLKEYGDELRELGIEPADGPQGQVDFPTTINGSDAYLSWRLDEPEVLFWRALDADPSDRHPLTAGSLLEQDAAQSASPSLDV